MSRFITYLKIVTRQVPEDFGVSVIGGTSMTIPGQGQDLGAIIASIVKLPPLDERTFDSPSNQEVDITALSMQVELDSLYAPEGVILAEEASARQKARVIAKANGDKPKEEFTDNEGAESDA